MHHYYKSGVWNAVCDRCGDELKSDQLRKEWTGLMVCSPCWELRHPADLIRPPAKESTPDWARPEGDDIFISVPEFLLTEDGEVTDPENGVLPLQTEG